MFAEDKPQSTSAERPDTVSQPAGIRRKHRASDDEWRLDIWRSYGSREVQPPSPFGCQLSPSRIFDDRECSPGATTPTYLWSPSSNDEPWGPDSLKEALDEDGHPDIVPGWPILTDASGEPVEETKMERWARIQQWSHQRTKGVPRAAPKRRHHLRTRRRSRERYAAATATKPMSQLDWSGSSGGYRPLLPEDVSLPSPPSNESSLLRTRRLMLLSRALPEGCRLRPARSAVRRRGQRLDDCEHQKKRERREPNAGHHHLCTTGRYTVVKHCW